MKIAVSLYEKTFKALLDQITKFSLYFSYFQIDISDGIYAPNKTVQIDEIKGVFPNHLVFDFHLMVNDYKTEIEKLENWKTGKLENILIHYSLKPSLQPPIGLVLNYDDKVEDLKKDYDLKKIPVIQIMTVEIGAQGNPFIPESLKKIEQLKNAGFGGKILLDGGINEKTLPQIIALKYKPDVLCVGSYLTKNPDFKNKVFFYE